MDLQVAGSPVEMAMAAVPAAVLVTPDAAMAADGVPSVVLGVTWTKRGKIREGKWLEAAGCLILKLHENSIKFLTLRGVI